MEAMEFEVGQRVVTVVDNVKVHGTVESVQLGKNLVDVKIYQPGNRSHCLIVARTPDLVTLTTDDAEADAPISITDISKDEVHRFTEHVNKTIDALRVRVEAAEGNRLRTVGDGGYVSQSYPNPNYHPDASKPAFDARETLVRNVPQGRTLDPNVSRDELNQWPEHSVGTGESAELIKSLSLRLDAVETQLHNLAETIAARPLVIDETTEHKKKEANLSGSLLDAKVHGA